MIQKAQSIGDFGLISDKLKKLKIAKDEQNKKAVSGIEKYIDNDNNSDDSDDPFQEEQTAGSMMSKEIEDPTKLIDLELIKLLNYCNTLRQYKE